LIDCRLARLVEPFLILVQRRLFRPAALPQIGNEAFLFSNLFLRLLVLSGESKYASQTIGEVEVVLDELLIVNEQFLVVAALLFAFVEARLIRRIKEVRQGGLAGSIKAVYESDLPVSL